MRSRFYEHLRSADVGRTGHEFSFRATQLLGVQSGARVPGPRRHVTPWLPSFVPYAHHKMRLPEGMTPLAHAGLREMGARRRQPGIAFVLVISDRSVRGPGDTCSTAPVAACSSRSASPTAGTARGTPREDCGPFSGLA